MSVEQFHSSFADLTMRCKTCENHCCRTYRKPIEVKSEELGVFARKGIPIYSSGNNFTYPIFLMGMVDNTFKNLDPGILKKMNSKFRIDPRSLAEWRENLETSIRNVNGEDIEKALIETQYFLFRKDGLDFFRKIFIFYSSSEFCPMYDENDKKCSIYENRPGICGEFPLIEELTDEPRPIFSLKPCPIVAENPFLRDFLRDSTVIDRT